tara:strand:+ start:810 stop:1163 length:354 start_codon:yes stop_codon:yes gene_type:complete
MAGPFKMKGSPMARNFGAPFKQEKLFGIGDSTDTSGKPVMAVLVNKQQLTKEQRDAYNHVKAVKKKNDPLSSDNDYNVADKTREQVKKNKKAKKNKKLANEGSRVDKKGNVNLNFTS